MEQATEKVQELSHQATEQASNIASEWRVQMSERSIQMRDQLTKSMRSVSSELRQMSSMPSTSSNMGHQLAHQGAEMLDRFASTLDAREPGDWLVEARSYARQHPSQVMGAFFVGGLLFGRMARSSSVASGQHQQSVDLRATTAPEYLP